MELICAATPALIAVLLTIAQPAVSAPLHDHDNGPLTGYFGIPDSTESGDIHERGTRRWSILLTTASHSIVDQGNSESIILDGETTRLEFGYKRTITTGLEFGIEVPFLSHESGGLDALIDNWHDWFGLPDGSRGDRPRDRLEFLYTDGAGTPVDHRSNDNGIGDVRIFAGWQLRKTATSATALRLGVKFPTGDSDSLLGSGGTDISIGLAGDHQGFFGVSGLSGFYRANVIVIGEPDLIEERYKDYVGQLAFGTGYAVTENIELVVQASVRSALYDSNVDTLGDAAATLTLGGNIRLSSNIVLGLGVSEDIYVNSAPDVAFQLSFQYRPR